MGIMAAGMIAGATPGMASSRPSISPSAEAMRQIAQATCEAVNRLGTEWEAIFRPPTMNPALSDSQRLAATFIALEAANELRTFGNRALDISLERFGADLKRDSSLILDTRYVFEATRAQACALAAVGIDASGGLAQALKKHRDQSAKR
jgi:hypothetical protein